MQREPFEFSTLVENFRSPAVLLRRRFDIAQHGADVNRLAEIAAKIFTELLHAKNFTQSRGDAKKFLMRISWINTDDLTANHAKYANKTKTVFPFRVFGVFRG